MKGPSAQPRPGGLQIPDGLVAGSPELAPAILEFWIPKREENRRTPCWVPHGSQRGDVEIRTTFRDSAGPRSLVFDLRIAHDRFGSSSHVLQNGLLTHTQYLDGPLRVAAQRKINAYGQQYADNRNISFLPLVMSTSCRAQCAVTLRSAPSRAATARAVA